jgi:hypothetical protein
MSPVVVKSPGKGDDRDVEEGTVSGGMLPFMASASINSDVLIVSRFPEAAALVLAVAFATLSGLEDGLDVFGVHDRVGAAYVLEDRRGPNNKGFRVMLTPNKRVRFMLLVKANIIGVNDQNVCAELF